MTMLFALFPSFDHDDEDDNSLSLSLSLFISMRVETLWRFDEKFDEKCLVLCVGFLKTPKNRKKNGKKVTRTLHFHSFIYLFTGKRERDKQK
jgi:hypothetical protein